MKENPDDSMNTVGCEVYSGAIEGSNFRLSPFYGDRDA
jgi:hypothetical protein